jgi:anti-sigma factor RsiW
MICRTVKSKMPDLLLAPESVAADVRAHLESCADCAKELRELEATMALMDGWDAPEASPYFDGRMQVLLREETEAEPAGWWERMRARFAYGEKVNMRPLAAAALALVLAVGGGLYEGMTAHHSHGPAQVAASPVVRDLQSLDENAQVFQQLSSMDQQDDSGDANSL